MSNREPESRVERWAVVDCNGAPFCIDANNVLQTKERAEATAALYNGLGGWKKFQPLRAVRRADRNVLWPDPGKEAWQDVRAAIDATIGEPAHA